MRMAGSSCPAGSSPSPRGTHRRALADFMDSNLSEGKRNGKSIQFQCTQ